LERCEVFVLLSQKKAGISPLKRLASSASVIPAEAKRNAGIHFRGGAI
jgi:hypothetical protein